ncbi:MAG: DUF58 domain-containing protein [Campylobacterales bacterium]
MRRATEVGEVLKRIKKLEKRWEERLPPFFQVKVKREKYFRYLIFGIILLFVGAYVHNNNIAFIVMFSIGVVGSWAIFLGRLNLGRLQFQFLGFERAFANRKVRGVGKLSSPRSFDLHIPGGEVIPVLKGERKIGVELQFPTRGVHKLGEIVIWSSYPLYLAKFFRSFKIGEKIIVYPEPKGRGLEEKFQLGRSFLGERGEFDGIREYQLGDTIRDLHWASVAKGKPMSKKFLHHSREGQLIFDYNQLDGDKEARLSQLTRWVLEGEERKVPFLVRLPGKELRSSEGVEQILKTLALY